jgi:hypothetical protein
MEWKCPQDSNISKLVLVYMDGNTHGVYSFDFMNAAILLQRKGKFEYRSFNWFMLMTCDFAFAFDLLCCRLHTIPPTQLQRCIPDH